MVTNTDKTNQHARWIDLLLPAVGLTALWFALGADDASALLIGAGAVVVGVWTALYLAPGRATRLQPVGIVRFVPYFVWLSLAGGWDVATRALGATVRLQPGMIEYALRAPEGAARSYFLLMISLLPGTLSADIEGDRLMVHVLDTALDNAGALATLEERVAAVFGVTLPPPDDGRQ